MPKTLNLKNGIDWWLAGLNYFIPSTLRRFVNTKELITLKLEEQQVLIQYFRNDLEKAIETQSFNIEDEIERTAVLNWLNNKSTFKTKVILLVPEEFCLTNTLAFPKAAASNLRQVLSFEISRITPFTSEQTYYDYKLIHSTDNKDKIHIKLYLVPRNRIDDQLENINNWNITLDKIQPVNYPNDDINLIAPEDRPQNKTKTDISLLFLTTVTCLLFIALLFVPIIHQQKELSLLKQKVYESQKIAIQLKELRQQQKKLLEQSLFLEKKRNKEVNSIELLNEVSKVTLNDTWLTRFVMKSGELQLQGESSNASSLIEILETSQYLANVKFRAPVTKNKTSNKDKFHLSANYKKER